MKNFDLVDYDDIFDDIIDFEEELMRNTTPTEAAKEFKNGKMVIAEGCKYSLDDYATKVSNNVLIVGSVGCGKTRNIVSPNIYEAIGSYVITDPKGNLYKNFGDYLRSKGYDVKLLDFVNPEQSVKYNPFGYIKNTQDIFKISHAIVYSNKDATNSRDPYWEELSVCFLNALIGLLYEKDKAETTTDKCNIRNILGLLQDGVRKDEEFCDTRLTAIFREHQHRYPDSWACKQFANCGFTPPRTYECIRSTLVGRLNSFNTVEFEIMLGANDFTFRDIVNKKTAVFVTVSDTDRSLDGIVNLFYTQAMNELCNYADTECYDNRLPIPVRFILDDFATNCKINEFPRMISSFRSRAISVMLMIQAESQLTACYGDDAQTIISNCDTYAYLGGNDPKTQREVSERADRPFREIAFMPIGDCLVFRRGNKPVKTTLINPEKCIEEMLSARPKEREAC